MAPPLVVKDERPGDTEEVPDMVADDDNDDAPDAGGDDALSAPEAGDCTGMMCADDDDGSVRPGMISPL